MYRLLSFFLLGLLLTSCSTRQAVPAPGGSLPNVLLIMTDDQGYGDLGIHGNAAIRTPVLDELAGSSTRFREFYVSPVCAPTRSALLTGRYTLRTGVFDTYNGGAIMAARETTLGELFKSHGYRTAVFGKWHLGDSYPSRPADQGFDESLVHLGGGIGQVGDYVNYHAYDSSYFDPVLFRNGTPVATKGYCSDVYTDAAIDFIGQERDAPFFVYLAFNAPHTPLQVPQEYYDRYRALDSVPGHSELVAAGLPEENLMGIENLRRLYGMVTNIDDNVGRLLAGLKEKGLEENTLVVFLTDNGPQQHRYRAGLRGRKGTVYEGGIRVPCFFRWPGRLAAGSELDAYAAHIDMAPTLLGLCGLPVPDSLQLDGLDLSASLLGEETPPGDRPLFFEWQRGYPEPYRNVAVRRGPYKLVGQAGHLANVEQLELYNLADDPAETRNLSREKPEIARELKALFDAWLPEALASPSVGDTRIVIGSDHENPVVLNRNDARGSPGIWRQEQIYGYWDVEVAAAGRYDFKVHFFDPVGQPGELVVRMGSVQRTVNNVDTTARLMIVEEVPLTAGKSMVECWYVGKDWPQSGGPAFTHFPFFVEVERKGGRRQL